MTTVRDEKGRHSNRRDLGGAASDVKEELGCGCMTFTKGFFKEGMGVHFVAGLATRASRWKLRPIKVGKQIVSQLVQF